MIVGLAEGSTRGVTTMAEGQRMTVEEVVAKLMSDEHVDFVRESLRWVVEQLMEAEVSQLIGAELGERTPDRATHRNGYRSRRWDTGPARSSCRSRSCAAAATSRASWSRAVVPSGRC
jgi:Transposase, Mutator family